MVYEEESPEDFKARLLSLGWGPKRLTEEMLENFQAMHDIDCESRAELWLRTDASRRLLWQRRRRFQEAAQADAHMEGIRSVRRLDQSSVMIRRMLLTFWTVRAP